jgi:hypothetical protein
MIYDRLLLLLYEVFYLNLSWLVCLLYLNLGLLVLIFFSSIYCRLMAGRPISGIGSGSTSSTPTLIDSTMPSIDSSA